MPLIFPTNGSNDVCICGIDPGTNFLGLSALTFDIKTFDVKHIEARSYQSDKMTSNDDVIVISHSERAEKLLAQKANLVRRFRHYRPAVICCESPFYNRLRPSAFGPLVEVVSIIRAAVIEYNPMVRFIMYEPSIVKKTVGAHATKGNKQAVKDALMTHEEIVGNFDGILSNLDEHAIDSIAVAYTHLINIRK